MKEESNAIEDPYLELAMRLSALPEDSLIALEKLVDALEATHSHPWEDSSLRNEVV